MSELKITRRHLPHWSLEGSTYFVTFHAQGTVLTEIEQRIVRDHIIEGDGKFYECHAANILPDHGHLIIKRAPSRHWRTSLATRIIRQNHSRRD